MKSHPHLASKKVLSLCLPLDDLHLLGIGRGIQDFCQSNGNWYIWMPTPMQYKEWIENLGRPVDAVILHSIYSKAYNDDLYQSDLPAINISNALLESRFPRVVTDDRLVGASIANYFLERNYRNFLFIPSYIHRYSELRKSGFVSVINSHGYQCHELPFTICQRHNWEFSESEKDNEFVKQLPIPLAVMAANDEGASAFINYITSLGFRVPEEVAVVGVDNCVRPQLRCPIPISSIPLPSWEIGFEAMRILDRICSLPIPIVDRKQHLPAETTLPSTHIITRRSSDITAIEDNMVAKVIGQMNVDLRIVPDVEAISKSAGMSRRGFELRFKKSTGFTPYDYFQRLRVSRAKDLLVNSSFSVGEISTLLGFSEQKQLWRLFQTATGESPSSYRLRLRQNLSE